jgi:rod shape determining protein RodA
MSIPLRGLQISFESKDRFGSLLASGIVALIFFHVAINMGIVIGLLPVTGVPLSFMSYGGSHLLMSMLAVGIILSIKLRKFAN